MNGKDFSQKFTISSLPLKNEEYLISILINRHPCERRDPAEASSKSFVRILIFASIKNSEGGTSMN